MNSWLYAFIISILVFLLIIDWHTFTRNLWAGLISMIYTFGINTIAYKLNYWNYLRVNEGIPKLILFPEYINIFFLAISFTMGIIFVQVLPKNYFLQLIHAFVWTLFFRLLLGIAEQYGIVHFFHWKVWMFFYIIPVNILALVWLKNTISERVDTAQNESSDRNTTK